MVTKRRQNNFRMQITLEENVDKAVLTRAVSQRMEEIRIYPVARHAEAERAPVLAEYGQRSHERIFRVGDSHGTVVADIIGRQQ